MNRRPAAALLAALVAVAVLAIPMAQSARAATSGSAGIVPGASCVPIDYDSETPDIQDVTIRGHGFEPGSTVDIYVNVVGSESFPDPSDTRNVDDLGVFVGRVGLLLPGSPLAFVLTAVTRGQDGPQATAQIGAPCPPTVKVTPTCVAPDAPFDMSFVADGFSPGGSLQVGLFLPSGVTSIVSDPLTADDRGHAEYTFRGVGPLPAGTYQAAAVQGANRSAIARINPRGAVAQTPVELPCPTPRIALDPNCAPAGGPQDRYDVSVAGTGFAYGSAVLTWDVGGSDEEFAIREVGDNGVFSVRIDPRQRAPGSRIRVRVTQTFRLEAGSGENDPLLGPNATASAPPRVARATFRVPCRPTATPAMTLDPDCDTPALVGDAERRYTIGVSASALVPGPVDIVFDAGEAAADVTPPEHFLGDVGKDGQLASVTITPLARPVGEYRVSLVQGEASVVDQTFRVPCQKPTAVLRPLQPTCGPITPGVPDSYSIRVRGRGFYPGAVELTFDQKGTPETQSATVDASGRFDVQLPGIGRDRGDYTVLARQRDARGTVLRGTRVFSVPCVQPTMVLVPLAGPPGTTTMVTGTDFPPDTVVTLAWDRGITASAPVQVTTDRSGTFEVRIFLLPHDLPGLRVLSAGTLADPAAFPGVTADYLVVAGTGQPPGGPGDPGSVIFRR